MNFPGQANGVCADSVNSVDTEGHSSGFIQVLDDSMCVIREDLTDWLHSYLFSPVGVPSIEACDLLHRLSSGLWLSRLAFKLDQSVLKTGSAPPKSSISNSASYNFLRGGVSNQELKNVSKSSLPSFPRTLAVCAGLPLGPQDIASDPTGRSGSTDLQTYRTDTGVLHFEQNSNDSLPGRRVADRWMARDNVTTFIKWCNDLGIPQTVLFETTGLVHRTEEKNVLLTLMELARIASRFGLTDLPELVRMEREIEFLEAACSSPANQSNSPTDLVVVHETAMSRPEVKLRQQNRHFSDNCDALIGPGTIVPPVALTTTSCHGSKTSIHTQLLDEANGSISLSRSNSQSNVSISAHIDHVTSISSHDISVQNFGSMTKLDSRTQSKEDATSHVHKSSNINSADRVGPSGDFICQVNFAHTRADDDVYPGTPTSRRSSDTFVKKQVLTAGRKRISSHNYSSGEFSMVPDDDSLTPTSSKLRKMMTCNTREFEPTPTFPTHLCTPEHTDMLLRTPVTALNKLAIQRSPSCDLLPPRTDSYPIDNSISAHSSAVASCSPIKGTLPQINTSVSDSSIDQLFKYVTERKRYKQLLPETDYHVAEQVANRIASCTCCERLHMQRLEEGRYRLGSRTYYLRQFKNHVMVRVGGGWLTLDAFLDRHDPCRRGIRSFHFPNSAASSAPSSPENDRASNSSCTDLSKNRATSKKHLSTKHPNGTRDNHDGRYTVRSIKTSSTAVTSTTNGSRRGSDVVVTGVTNTNNPTYSRIRSSFRPTTPRGPSLRTASRLRDSSGTRQSLRKQNVRSRTLSVDRA